MAHVQTVSERRCQNRRLSDWQAFHAYEDGSHGWFSRMVLRKMVLTKVVLRKMVLRMMIPCRRSRIGKTPVIISGRRSA